MRNVEEYFSDIIIDEGLGVPTRNGYKVINGKDVWGYEVGMVKNISREVGTGYGGKWRIGTVKRFFYFISDGSRDLKDSLERFMIFENMMRSMRHVG